MSEEKTMEQCKTCHGTGKITKFGQDKHTHYKCISCDGTGFTSDSVNRLVDSENIDKVDQPEQTPVNYPELPDNWYGWLCARIPELKKGENKFWIEQAFAEMGKSTTVKTLQDIPIEIKEHCMNCSKEFNINEAGCICPKCFIDCTEEVAPPKSEGKTLDECMKEASKELGVDNYPECFKGYEPALEFIKLTCIKFRSQPVPVTEVSEIKLNPLTLNHN